MAPSPDDAPRIRPATEADLDALNAIYNREVREGIATWELDEWPAEQRLAWFRARDHQEPVIVAEVAGRLAGFAYLTKYRGRRGYRFTRENTVFIDTPYQRRGVGRVLLQAVMEAGHGLGLRSLLAFIDQANTGSIELHRALGYTEVGREFETGYKFGEWRSSVELQYLYERPTVAD